jgi:hypothetical protein
MTLHPFVGLWQLFQCLDPIHSQQDSLDGGSARRKASTYTQNSTNRINAHNTGIHALSSIRTHDPRVQASEDSSCLRPRSHCDWRIYITTPKNIRTYQVDWSRAAGVTFGTESHHCTPATESINTLAVQQVLLQNNQIHDLQTK